VGVDGDEPEARLVGGPGSSVGRVGSRFRQADTAGGEGPVGHDPPGCEREEVTGVEAESIRQTGRVVLAMTGFQGQQT
jgi:hypothetical protein